MQQKLAQLFSDHQRSLKLRSAILLIIGLCTYAVIVGPRTEITFSEIKDHPREYLGKYIAFSGSIVEIVYGGYLVNDRGMTIEIHDLPDDLAPQTVISGTGRIKINNGKMTIGASKYHIHYEQQLKILSGIVALPILFVLFLRRYHFDWKKRMWNHI